RPQHDCPERLARPGTLLPPPPRGPGRPGRGSGDLKRSEPHSECDSMSDETSPALLERLTRPDRIKYYLLGGARILAALLAYLYFGGAASTQPGKTTPERSQDDPQQIVRAQLNKITDLNACQDAVNLLNQLLVKQSADAFWKLTEGEQSYLAGMPE